MLVVNARFLTQKITGVQRYAIEVSLELKRLYRDVIFIAPQNIIHRDIAKTLDVKICGRLTGHLWEQIDLPIHLNKCGKPLLLNLANTAPLLYDNKIVTIHDLAFLVNPDWYSKKFYYFYKFLIPRIAKNSLKIITVSEYSRQEIIKRLNVSYDKIEVIYCAISDKFLNSVNNSMPNKYGKYILAVSSLNPRKNFEGIVSAFNKLNLRDTKLVIVGCESKHVNNPKLKTIIQSNNQIVFAGHVSDDELIGLYKNAGLLVFPSLYEGFGMPPLEAMACGCSCLVSNTSSLPEVCGDAALFCDPYDILDIADKMRRLLEDSESRKQLTKQGYSQINKFSWSKAAKAFLGVCEKLNNGKNCVSPRLVNNARRRRKSIC